MRCILSLILAIALLTGCAAPNAVAADTPEAGAAPGTAAADLPEDSTAPSTAAAELSEDSAAWKLSDFEPALC